MGNTNRFDIFSVRDIVLFRFRMVFGPVWNDLFLALAAASLGMVWLCSFNLLRLGVLFVCFVTLCWVVLGCVGLCCVVLCCVILFCFVWLFFSFVACFLFVFMFVVVPSVFPGGSAWVWEVLNLSRTSF